MTSSLPIALSLSLLASVAPAAAQEATGTLPVDSRWLPYLGCWRQLEETVREDDAGLDEKAERMMTATAGVVICVRPTANPAAVTLSTVVEKQASFEETIVADGSTQPVGEPGCEGTQRAEWSANGVRLIAKADLKCADGSQRSVSGLTLIAPGARWIDIQVVSSNGREGVRVRRYQRSSDQTRVLDVLTDIQLAQAAGAAASRAAKFTLEEVKQSTGKLPSSVIEAALVETGAGFPLNAKRLQELDQAGVSPRVIDLMIALSFPNKFIVERDTASTSARPGSRYGGAGGGSGLPWLVDEDLYDLWPYRYSPFAYGLWGYDYYYDFYNGPIYAVPPGGGGVPPAPSEHGLVVNGAGYTQVRSRPPEPASGSGGIFSGGDGGSSGGGTSSSGGGVSTQGYSSGGGGGDGGRSAMPRPPK